MIRFYLQNTDCARNLLFKQLHTSNKLQILHNLSFYLQLYMLSIKMHIKDNAYDL